MPSLKDLTCSIELSDNQTPLQEFGTIYGDGLVETFVPVPNKPHPFSIHLSSNRFIAPGVAMYVFIDGIYQCNRNRQDLKLRKPKDSRSLVDFRVRQKEERQKDGSMIAREWTFEKLNASTNDAPDLCSPNILDNIGCIEVIVLRCAGPRNAKTVSNMNLDGAGDELELRFGMDGQLDGRFIYDDRLPFFSGRSSRGPSSSSRYRPPYAETAPSRGSKTAYGWRSSHAGKEAPPPSSPSSRHHARSRFSEPIDPGTRPKSNISFSGVQYGSGPIPRDGSDKDHTLSSLSSSNGPILDPAWLDKLVTTAVKRGVEEARRSEIILEKPIEQNKAVIDIETASHLPGSWPMSPFSTPVQATSAESNTPDIDEDHGTSWVESQSNWKQPQTQSRAGTRVTWNEDAVWDTSSQAEGWASLEDNNIDSWDTDGTWAPTEPNVGETGSRRGRSKAPTVRSMRATSPVTIRTRRSRSRISHPRSSISREELRSSSGSNKGWSHGEHVSSSDNSREMSDDTIRPEHSRSQVTASKSRWKRRTSSHRSEQLHTSSSPSSSHHSNQTRHTPSHDRKSTHHTREDPIWNPPTATPPVIPITAPTIYPTHIPSRKTSTHTEPAMTIAPPPSWGCAVPEKTRKRSMATTYTPPTPYGAALDEFIQSTNSAGKNESRSVSSSSWGFGNKDSEAKKSVKGMSDRSSSWSSSGKEKKDKNEKGVWGWEDGKKSDADKSSWGDGDGNGDGDEEGKQTVWKDGDAKSSWGDSIDEKTEWDNNNNKNNSNNKNDDISWGKSIDEKDNSNWDPSNNKWPTSPHKPILKPNTWSNTTNKKNNKTRNKEPIPKHNPPNTPAIAIPTATAAVDLWPTTTTTTTSWQTPPPHPHPPSSTSPLSKSKSISKSISEPTKNPPNHHKVLAGKGIPYGHIIGRPEYVDGLDKPYAVFRFKYRAWDVLRGMFGSVYQGEEKEGEEKEGEMEGGGEKMRIGRSKSKYEGREWTERWVEGQVTGGRRRGGLDG